MGTEREETLRLTTLGPRAVSLFISERMQEQAWPYYSSAFPEALDIEIFVACVSETASSSIPVISSKILRSMGGDLNKL